MKVFIIGNGFDRAHNMPTSYECFHKYLDDTYPGIADSYLYVPTSTIAPDGADVIDETATVSLLCYLIKEVSGENWSDLEKTLGDLDLIACFDDLSEVYDRDGDRNLWHEAYNNEDRAADLYLAIPKIKDLFSDWIETIKLPDFKLKAFEEIIDPEKDLFLTFNYTYTLEEIYGCKNVVHLHGKLGEEIIFGHNGNQDYSEENPQVPIGCFGTLEDIYEELRKNVDENIVRHFIHLKRVEDCTEIYSFGFSYSMVDLPYIKTICQLLNDRDVLWLNNSFDGESKIKEYESLINESGFKGHFGVYNI